MSTTLALRDAVVVATGRTPFGRANTGSLTDMRPDDLTAIAIAGTMARVPGVSWDSIEDLILGCGLLGGCDSGEFHLPPGDDEALKVTVIAILNVGVRIAAWFEPGGLMSAETAADVHAALAVAMVTGDNGSSPITAPCRPVLSLAT